MPLWLPGFLQVIGAIASIVMSGYAIYLFVRMGEQIASSIQQYAPIIGALMAVMVGMFMLYPIIMLVTTVVRGVKG